MATSSFTVQKYASKDWAVTFDIVHKDGTPLSKDEIIQVQSPYEAPQERKELLAIMETCIHEVFGDDISNFTVHFMRKGLTSNGPQYWHYFDGDPIMGGNIEFFFMDKIMTIPGMVERLEVLMQKIVEKVQTYAIKIVHVNVGTIHAPKCHGSGSHDLDTYTFSTELNYNM